MSISSPYVRSRTGSTDINGLSKEVLDNNKTRKYLMLRNLSTTETIFLAITKPAELEEGIVLFPKEGYEMNDTNIGYGDINAIATGNAKLAWLEGY